MKRVLFLVIVISLLITGCSSGAVIAEKDGSMIRTSLQEIYDNADYGFFVKNLDGTYTPVMSDTPGKSSGGFNFFGNGNVPFFWWCDTPKISHENLVPVVTTDTPLVAVYGADSKMPSEYYIEKFVDLGYTVGVKFQIGTDQRSLYFGSDDLCPNSTFKKIAETVPDKLTRVIEINDNGNLPLGNIDPNTHTLLGLQKDKYYKFTCFVGTSTRGYTASADTRVFKMEEYIPLDIPLTETRNHYFLVNLPTNLQEGYYYINNVGLFKVAPQEEETLVDDPVQDISTEESTGLSKEILITAGVATLVMTILFILGLWKLFGKIGIPSWKALIPLYNLYLLANFVWKNKVISLLVLVPAVGLIFLMITEYKLAQKFKKGTAFSIMTMLFPCIFNLIIGIDESQSEGGVA